jgi:BirA family biotin operon repressor/biotin-[acetyl-CoA-carboxylase] ligase
VLRHEFSQVMEEWKKRSATLKKRIRITDPNGAIEGEAFDLDEDGALLIRKDNGIIVKKTAGDIFLLR